MSNLLYWRCTRSLHTYLSIRYAGYRPLPPMIRHFHDDDSGPKDTKKHMRSRLPKKDEKISTDLKLVDTISIKSQIRSNTAPKSSDAKTSSKSSQTVGDQSKNKADSIESKASAVETRVRAFVDSKESKKTSNQKPVQSQPDKEVSKTTEKQVKSAGPVTSNSNKNAGSKLTDKSSKASQTESQKVSSKEDGKIDFKTWASSQSVVDNKKLFDGQQESCQTQISQKGSESPRNLADKNVGRLSKTDPQVPWEGMFGELFKTRAKLPIEGGTKGVDPKANKSQSLVVNSHKQNSEDNNKIESAGEAKSLSERNIQKSISKTKPEPDHSLTNDTRSNSLGSTVQNPPKTEAPTTEIKNTTILNPWRTETSRSNSMEKAESSRAQTKDPRCKKRAKFAVGGKVDEKYSAFKSAVPLKNKSNTSFKFGGKVSKPVQSQTEFKTAVIKEDEALKDLLKSSNKHDEWIAKILSQPNKAYESSKIKSDSANRIEDRFSKAHPNKSDNKFAPSTTDEASKDKSNILSEDKVTAPESDKTSKDIYSRTFKATDGFSKAKPYQMQSDNKSTLNKPSSQFDEASKNKSNSLYNVKSWNSKAKHSQNHAMKPDEASKGKPKSFNKDGARFHKLKPPQSQPDNKPSAEKSNKSNSIYKVTDFSSKALQNQSTNKYAANKEDEASKKDLSTTEKTGNDLLESFSAVRTPPIADRKLSGDTTKAEKTELLTANTAAEKAFKTRSKSAYIPNGNNSDFKCRSSIEQPSSCNKRAEIEQSARPQLELKSLPKTKSAAFGSVEKPNRGTIASLLQAVRKLPMRQDKGAKSHQEEVVSRLREKIKEEEKKAEFLEILAEELQSRREADTNPQKENKLNPTTTGNASSTVGSGTTKVAISKDKPGSERDISATIAAAIVKGLSESSATSKESDTIAGKSMPTVTLQELVSLEQRDCHTTSSSLGNSNSGKTSYGKTEFLAANYVTKVDNVKPDLKKVDKKFRTDCALDKGNDDKTSKDITCNENVKSTEKTNQIKAEDITPDILYNSTKESENRGFSKSLNIGIDDDDETLRFKAEQFLRESEARQILEKTKHIKIQKLDVDKLGADKRDVDERNVDKPDVAKLDAAKPDVVKLDVDELDVSAQQKPKPKLTISQYLYEMFMGKRKNNNESGRRSITTYSVVHNQNTRLDNHTENKSRTTFRPTASKKTEDTFISPDLEKRQLGKEAILKERRSKSQEDRSGEDDKASRHRFDDQFDMSCSEQLVLPQLVGLPAISDQKQTLTPTLNDSVIVRVQKTESEEKLVHFADGTDSTKILGGTPYKCVDKSLRTKLKNKKDKNEIVIKGGSKKCSDKLKNVKETEEDGECGKRSFGALGRQLFQNLQPKRNTKGLLILATKNLSMCNSWNQVWKSSIR